MSRLVERHGYSWQSLLDLVDAHGPAEAIECVRRADVASPPARGKPHDDASVVFLRFDTESGDTDGNTDTDTDGGAPG